MLLTLRVTVGSRSALEIRCPSRVLVRRKRKRMFVALVNSLRVLEKAKFFAPGRPFIKDTTTLKKRRKKKRKKRTHQTKVLFSKCSNKTLKTVYAPKAPGSLRSP